MTHSFFSSISSGLIATTAMLSLPDCSRSTDTPPVDASNAIADPHVTDVDVIDVDACVQQKIFVDAASCSRLSDLFGPGRRFSIWSHGVGTTLSQDQEIQGVNCPAGSFISFYKSGRLNHTHTTAPGQMIQGMTINPHKGVDLYENGQLESAVLALDTTIQGLTCSKDTRVGFHENGQLSRCERVAIDAVIQGLPCGNASSYFSFIDFYANGRLKRCDHIAADSVIQGMTLMKGTHVSFHENGQLAYGILAADTVIQGIAFPRESVVTFLESGKLGVVIIGADVELEGKKCEQGMEVSFSHGIRCQHPDPDYD